jgi:uncharacterized protein YdbL (DUF1318 family)
MKSLKILAFVFAIVIVGCTINVRITFPETEFQDAANKIVDEVQKGAHSQPDDATSPSSALPRLNNAPAWSLFSYAYAKDEKKIDITISNAEIEAIKARMQKNFDDYKKYKDNGSVGETLNGYLEERREGSGKLDTTAQKDLRKLITRENADRKQLYLALLKANNYDDSQLSKIEEIFAKSWYEKADNTWYVRYNDPDKGLVWLTKAEWQAKQK